MKLSHIIETVDRRQFLKSAAATGLALATSGVPLVSGSALASTANLDSSTDDLWELINQGAGYSAYDDADSNISSTPDEIIQAIRRLFNSEDPKMIGNAFENLNATEFVDQYTDGAYTQIATDYVAKHGPVKTVQQFVEYTIDMHGPAGVGDELVTLTDQFPTITKLVGVDPASLDTDQLLQHLHKRGLLTPEAQQSLLRQRRKNEKWQKEYDYYQTDRDYHRQQLQQWADDGGRAFEAKLRKVFNSINEARDLGHQDYKSYWLVATH